MKLTLKYVKNEIAASIVISENKLEPKVSFENELQVDSFEWVKLAADIEKNIGVSIDLDMLKQLDTIENIYKKIVEERIKEMIATMFLTDKSSITSSQKIMDMDGVDSQNIFQFLLALEKEFNVLISDNVPLTDLENITSIVGFIYEYNEELGGDK